VRILVLCSAFNGLTQRVWLQLRRAGHEVTVELALSGQLMVEAARLAEPDLVICPFLKERVPAEVWKVWPTIIVHPGPLGDRGPSAVDWAVAGAEPVWGVTVLAAVKELDAGDIWASVRFPMPAEPPRKSTLYNGLIADAAVALVREVVAKAVDPVFIADPQDYSRPDVISYPRPLLRQAGRAFNWSDDVRHILRTIRAADGRPGVLSQLCGRPVYLYDAHPAGPVEDAPGAAGGTGTPGALGAAAPGTVAARRDGAVLVRAGGGGIWIGQLRRRPEPGERTLKLPATAVLGDLVAAVPVVPLPVTDDGQPGYREIGYRRHGAVGVLTFDFYNGALCTAACRRLLAALRHALRQDTRVLVLRGGEVFGNGIHLTVIEAATDPAAEAWRNIVAIEDLCQEIITADGQLLVAAIGGNAGAGGLMLGLGADHVLVRDGAVLNPHYLTMGLSGAEFWTYTLPRRVGAATAARLTAECLPIDARGAIELGLADALLPGDRAGFDAAVLRFAHDLAAGDVDWALTFKRARRAGDERDRPLADYRAAELAQMRRDLFDDRRGFAAARRAFVYKERPPATPLRLARHRT
jgi:putative two-component system hydrogenase maturation factor HypX/HoxX